MQTTRVTPSAQAPVLNQGTDRRAAGGSERVPAAWCSWLPLRGSAPISSIASCTKQWPRRRRRKCCPLCHRPYWSTRGSGRRLKRSYTRPPCRPSQRPGREFHLLIAPVIAGGGEPNLQDRASLKLELLDEGRFGTGRMHLRYGAKS